MSATEILRGRLCDLQRRTSSSQGSKEFYPFNNVKEILTPENIRDCISLFPFFRKNELDVPRFVNLIADNSVKIFAILLRNGHEQHILDFLFRRYNDSSIPTAEESLHFLPKHVKQDFISRLWGFDYVVLHRGEIRLDIESKRILPFLEDEEIGEGAYGFVFKVKLLSSCQSLVAPSEFEVHDCHNLAHTCG
jgi:hypothetical protein